VVYLFLLKNSQKLMLPPDLKGNSTAVTGTRKAWQAAHPTTMPLASTGNKTHQQRMVLQLQRPGHDQRVVGSPHPRRHPREQRRILHHSGHSDHVLNHRGRREPKEAHGRRPAEARQEA